MACNNSDCEQRVSVKPSCLGSFVRYAKHTCYTIGDGIINIFCALKDIATAIREYTEKATQKGYASGILQFKYSESDTVNNNDITEIQFSKTPFNLRVLGIGCSIIDFNDCGGQYFAESSITVKFWDFTTNQQIGDSLLLTSSQLIDKQSNEGISIDDDISPGHIYGVKLLYQNNDGAICELPDIDFYLLITPTEIIVEE